jgi:hypothetical protein
MKKKQQGNQFTKLNEKDLKHLFDLAVINALFRFYNELYLQVDGVNMGVIWLQYWLIYLWNIVNNN